MTRAPRIYRLPDGGLLLEECQSKLRNASGCWRALSAQGLVGANPTPPL
jgi:hypothetical protein